MSSDKKKKNKNSILVVDDSRAFCEFVKEKLEKREYTVLTAGSVSEAWGTLKKHRVDLMVLDWQMPETDGIEMLKQVRRVPGPKKLPIIMVSGQNTPELIREALEYGCDDFVSKQDGFELLELRIYNVLSRSSLLREVQENALKLAGYSQDLERQVEYRTLDLELSEKRFAEFAETAADWLWETDAELRFTWFSKFYEDLGFEEKELLGKTRLELRSEAERKNSEKWKTHLADMEAHREFRSFEYQLQKKGGQVSWVSISGNPLFEENGVFKGYRGTGSDITFRKQTEAELEKHREHLEELMLERTRKLRESESKYRDLVENLPDLFFRTDLNGRFVFASGAIAEISGYTVEETVDEKTIKDLYVHPEAELSFVDQLREYGEIRNFVVELRRKDGSAWWGSVNARLIRDADGNTAEIEGAVRDISQRKLLENSLRESEARLQIVLESAQMGTWDANLRTGERFFNDHWAKMLGYAPEELRALAENGELERFWEGRLHPEDLSRVLERLERFFQRGWPYYQEEYRIKTKNLNTVWVQARGKIIELDAQGQPLRFVGVMQDITERKQTEEKLSQAKVYSEHLLDASPDTVIVTDETGTIVQVSARSQALFGYAQEDLPGRSVKTLISRGPDREHLERWNIFQTGDEIREIDENVELYARHKDGNLVPVDVGLSVIETEDGSRVIANVRDISTWRRTEQELRQARKKAEAANQAKTHFLANMSHEIRTPLNLIGGYSQMMVAAADSFKLPQEAQHHLNSIHEAGRHLSELVNNILDLSKIEAGKLETNPEDLSLKPLIQGVVQIHQAAARQKEVELSYLMDATLPAAIHSDRLKLNQILNNLIGNAVKFTPQGGKVQLELTNTTRISNHRRPSNVKRQLLIEVTDTGIGIPKNRMEVIFESFEQADTSTTREFGGTGLGLSLCKRFTEILGGGISVRSVEGEGSTFTVCLPLQEAISAKNRATETVQSFSGFAPDNVVLVVEDNAKIRKMMRSYFQKIGISAEFAENGKLGTEQATALCPDLILMDMHMPVMDGLEATKRIRKTSECAKTPIIGLSGDAFVRQRERATAAGMDAYLSKPVEFSELQILLRRYLRQDDSNPDTAETEKLSDGGPLPEDVVATLRELFDKLAETPPYLTLGVDRYLQKISIACASYQTPVKELVKKINAAQASGDHAAMKLLIAEGKELL